MGCVGLPDAAPHDLLALGPDGAAALVPAAGDALPAWVAEALGRAPWVVIRRAPLRGELIPVGVRGRVRGERFAAYLPPAAVARRVRPEDLAGARGWREHPRQELVGALAVLEPVATLCNAWGLAWGPTGSAGFELATGQRTVTGASDLDLLIRAPRPLTLDDARCLFQAIVTAASPTRVDIQVETGAGAVALAEYVRGKPPMLLRTTTGPHLVNDPWTGVPLSVNAGKAP